MRDDFAVFVLTHERAKNQRTAKTLRECGYTGRIFFVCDNEDSQLDEYKAIYGDSVFVFDKKAVWETTDTLDNRLELKAVVFARNKVFDFAEQVGVKTFCACDDDITRITYKMVVNGKLISKKAKKIDCFFDAVSDFINHSNATCLSLAEEGAFVGGVNSSVVRGTHWIMSHMMFYRTCDRVRYRGLFYEDVITSIDLAKAGKVAFATMFASMQTSKTGTNVGGMHEAYENSNAWCATFGVVKTNPDCAIVTYKSKINQRVDKDAFIPKIINAKYKKRAEYA